MKKLLDRYYLVLYRGYAAHSCARRGSIAKETSGLMSFTFALNILSCIRLIDVSMMPLVSSYLFIISGIIIMIIIQVILSIGYNQERRDKLIERYENESRKSRRYSVLWVVFYEVFSVALFVIPVCLR